MTWSYESTAPGSSAKSWVRMRIGDTSSGNALLSDEEILALLTDQGDKYLAAAVAAESIGAKYAIKTDKTVGRLSISMAKASEHYFTLATRLRAEAGSHAGLYAGGISADDEDDEEADTDRVEPGISIGQFDYPADVDDEDE